jgi:hypothetical protein
LNRFLELSRLELKLSFEAKVFRIKRIINWKGTTRRSFIQTAFPLCI